MATGKRINQATLRAVDGTEIIPGMRPDDVEGTGFTPPMLLAFNVHTSTSAPTLNDDSGDGHYVNRIWRHKDGDTDDVYLCLSAAVGAAVWKNISDSASITGLTNPLVSGLNAAGNLIYSAPFAGFRDRYYDLEADASSYVTAGVATLTSVYNAYLHADLTSALEIVLPDPSSVGGDDALFGIVSVRLGDGGSVTVSQDQPWVWESGSANSDAPEIPIDPGAVFRLRYSWDPVSEAYALSLSHLAAPTAVETAVTMVEGSLQVSNLAYGNKDVHTHTHTLVSDSQDGTKYLLVLFAADGNAAPSVVPSGLVPITTPPTGTGTQVQGLWYYYKFDSTDLSAGEVELSFTKANEIAQILTFEVSGAHATSPVGGTAFDRSSSSSRSGAGPVSLTPGSDGCLLVASYTCDVKGTNPTIAMPVTADFEPVGSYDSVGNDDVAFLVAVREAGTSASYESPTFTRSPADSYSQLEAFWLVPNA